MPSHDQTLNRSKQILQVQSVTHQAGLAHPTVSPSFRDTSWPWQFAGRRLSVNKHSVSCHSLSSVLQIPCRLAYLTTKSTSTHHHQLHWRLQTSPRHHQDLSLPGRIAHLQHRQVNQPPEDMLMQAADCTSLFLTVSYSCTFIYVLGVS